LEKILVSSDPEQLADIPVWNADVHIEVLWKQLRKESQLDILEDVLCQEPYSELDL
jgi:hypothetical protein